MLKHIMKGVMIMVTLQYGFSAESGFEVDTLHTQSGELIITFIGHGTLMLEYQDHFIHHQRRGGDAVADVFGSSQRVDRPVSATGRRVKAVQLTGGADRVYAAVGDCGRCPWPRSSRS